MTDQLQKARQPLIERLERAAGSQRAGLDTNLAALLDEAVAALVQVQQQLQRAVYIAEHLHQMVPKEVWREHGAECQGQYEGDYHAEQIQAELKELRAAAPVETPPAAELQPTIEDERRFFGAVEERRRAQASAGSE